MYVLPLNQNMLNEKDRSGGSLVRAFAPRAGGRGFDPRPRHTKDVKNGTICFLA